MFLKLTKMVLGYKSDGYAYIDTTEDILVNMNNIDTVRYYNLGSQLQIHDDIITVRETVDEIWARIGPISVSLDGALK